MAFRGHTLFRIVKSAGIIRQNAMTSSIAIPIRVKLTSSKEYKTENNFIHLEDPDTFGTLTGKPKTQNVTLEDEGDIKEHKFLENVPLPSHKLTIKQYADLIKQYLKHKRLKEAIDILEVRMIKQDRVKPDNYIFNILIGACADVGYTKKAFKLYNDMKRRGLQASGDTYTCLFEACANSPWTIDGLKNAKHLRELMIDKNIEPNLTNYNAMIKAFGRCGDVVTAFKIVDEMISKKIKIRVHTLNHLLHACIADKSSGLRHALVVWRKLLKLREKPNIYTFNLMLKCVKECNLGIREDIEELIYIINEQTPLAIKSSREILKIESLEENSLIQEQNISESIAKPFHKFKINDETQLNLRRNKETDVPTSETSNELAVTQNANNITLQFVNKLAKPEERMVPNLLSKVVKMQQVLSLQGVHTVQDKFAVVGGQDDFLKEMESFSVKPDIKTLTQMLFLIEETREAENKLLETMKSLDIKADIDFYNMLIKKRCLRSDYDGAFDVKKMIEVENKLRKKKYPLKKKLRLKNDIMTYGVLAMACKTQESAEKLLNEMKEQQLKVNIQILGTLLRHGTVQSQFSYVLYIMNVVKQENVKVNDVFIKHLEAFNDKCANIVQQDKNGQRKCSEVFVKAYKVFSITYSQWLKEIDVKQALEPEHPWKQFMESYPETLQRQNFEIVEPKRFYKRNRKYVHYTPRL